MPERVEHRKFEVKLGVGFAATYVPESETTPHMAKLGENRYYKRNQASFLQLEHFDLQDIFGRRPRPNLNLAIDHSASTNGVEGTQVDIWLENQGRGLAKYSSVFGTLRGATIITTSGNLRNVSHLNDGRPVFSYDDNVGVIHPRPVRMHLGKIIVRQSSEEPVVLELQ